MANLEASTQDPPLGGIAHVGDEQPEATIRLGELAAADGRLVDENRAPWASRRIHCGVRGTNVTGSFLSRPAVTGPDGRYELPRVVPGEMYEIGLDPNTRLPQVPFKIFKAFTPERAKSIKLGNTPATPPTP